MALLPWGLRFYTARLGIAGVFNPRAGTRREYFWGLGGLALLIALLYGGGVLFALTYFVGSGAGFYVVEIYGVAFALLLAALGTPTVTAVVRARRTKKVASLD
jgi:hypothetical protein